MATTCHVDLDTGGLRGEIRAIDNRDIIVASELSKSIRRDIDLWTG
jgi:hypothetical protein